MANYDFDEIIDRKGTNCVKHDFSPKLFGNDDIIPMWVADMDFKTPDFIISALKDRLNHEILAYSILSENYYISIIDWLKRRHNQTVEKEWILHSPGVVPALVVSILAFTNPGDKIIVQPPVYFPFFTSVLNNGRQVINNSLVCKNGSYEMDFETLEKQIDSRTKMLFLCNPHNPVGRVWKKQELQKLSDICLKNNILVVSDEIHSDLIMPENVHIPYSSLSEEASNNCITTISASKTFNLSGLSSSAVIIKNKKIRKLFENKIDDIHIWSPNIFGSLANETAFAKGDEWLNQLIDYLYENSKFVKNYFQKFIPQIKVFPLEGTYLMWLDCRTLNLSNKEIEEFFVKKLKLGVSYGHQFGEGGDGFIRLNIACPRKTLETALERIKNGLK